jgi:hypothetical protein
MTNVWMLLVALAATVTVAYQNVGSALAWGWAVVHSAGPAALIAFVPLTVGLVLLWGGYVVILRRKDLRRKPLSFAAWACSIIVLNELILPATPRQVAAMQRSLEGVKVSNIRDDLFLSAAGNPIGVRLTFSAVAARSGPYSVVPSALQPERGDTHYAFQFGRRIRDSIAPEPVAGQLTKGVVYTFDQVYLPMFVGYDERTAEPCFDARVLGHLSEDQIVPAISRATPTRLRTAIRVSRVEATDPVVAAEYVTERSYDLGAFYRTIVAEGKRRCDS